MKTNLQRFKGQIPVRLNRLRRLRELDVPKWVIKSEQVALVLNRRGLKYYGIGKTPSKIQADLWIKHVQPLMENQ